MVNYARYLNILDHSAINILWLLVPTKRKSYWMLMRVRSTARPQVHIYSLVATALNVLKRSSTWGWYSIAAQVPKLWYRTDSLSRGKHSIGLRILLLVMGGNTRTYVLFSLRFLFAVLWPMVVWFGRLCLWWPQTFPSISVFNLYLFSTGVVCGNYLVWGLGPQMWFCMWLALGSPWKYLWQKYAVDIMIE